MNDEFTRSKTHFGKKTLLAALSLIWCSALLLGINFVPGSGEDVGRGFPVDRERNFAYHTGMNDQQWSGTNKWAVRFDFAAEYPAADSARFNIDQVQMYFPRFQTVAPFDSVSIEIWSDQNSQTYQKLYSDSHSTQIDSCFMSIAIPAGLVDTMQVAWLVVILKSGNVNFPPYVSASYGDGSHSYYWNTTAPVPYYQNMANAGYHSEFLFGVRGNFDLALPDLELKTIGLTPQPVMNGWVRPVFTIINNSDQIASNAWISLLLYTADGSLSVRDSLAIATDIAPYGEYSSWDYNSSYTWENYHLPDVPTQLHLKMTLHSDYEETDATSLSNNSITRYYDCFSDRERMPITIVENFISGGSDNFFTSQDSITTGNAKILNFYPSMSDPHFSSGARQRSLWYGHIGFPVTTINGTDHIWGYAESSYADTLQKAVDDAQLQNTFCIIDTLGSTYFDSSNSLLIKFIAVNKATSLFDSPDDPSLVRASSFYAALFQKRQLNDRERLIFENWGAYQHSLDSALPIDEPSLMGINFTIPRDTLNTEYEIVYWIQHNETKQILYANSLDWSYNPHPDGAVTPVPREKVILAPNPVHMGNYVNLTLPEQYKSAKVKTTVFNLKGQAIHRQTFLAGQRVSIDTAKLPAAGMYIIKLTIPDQGKTINITRRLVIY